MARTAVYDLVLGIEGNGGVRERESVESCVH